MENYKALQRAVILLMAMFVMCGSNFVYAAQNVPIVERSDTEFLILGLEINGYSRSDGIEAYLPEESSPNDVLIPLRALSEALSISIDVDPSGGTATGFFLTEDKIFDLNMLNKQVISASQTFDLEENAAEAHFDDIYVKASVLSQWFELDIDLESSSLILYIDSDNTFPFEAAADRKQRAERLLSSSRKRDFDPKKAYLLPYGLYGLPAISLQKSLTATTTKEQDTLQASTNIQAGFDFLGFGTNLNISHAKDNQDTDEITNARLTFSRSDPKQEMFGKFKVGRIDIGDINFSTVPLFGGGARGAGVRLSSEADFGVRFSQQLGKITIDGDAPVSWDAELYRNGQFISFQTIGSNGRFNFEGITLINGFNRFQILLFGPEGQKRSFARDVFSGPSMLSEGQTRYNISAGMPQADFLPIAEESRKDNALGISGDILHGISNFLTLGASFYKGPQDEEDVTSAGVSASAAFYGFNTQLQGLYADKKRSAVQAAIRRRFLGVNTALTHTTFKNFEEDDQDIKNSTEISFSRNFGTLNVTLMGKKKSYIQQQDTTEIDAIISSQLFGTKFTNELTRTLSDNKQIDDFEGELSLFREIKGFRVRSSLNYDLDKDATDTLRTLRLSAQKKMGKYNALRLASTYDFPSNIISADLRYSREVGPVTLDFDIGGTNDETYFTGVSVRSSLQPRDGKYKFVQPRIGTLANLGVRAFIDENDNDVFDIGEQAIENILFKTSRGETEALTSESGIAWMYGLAETPTRIYVSQQDIPSIYIVPSKKGLDLIPRRGADSVVDFPFTQLGEIDGYVLSSLDGKSLSNVPIKVINLKTGEEVEQTASEYDGYYLFTALPIGEYKVIASQSWFEENNTDTDSKPATLSIKSPNILDLNLTVDPLVAEMDVQEEEGALETSLE